MKISQLKRLRDLNIELLETLAQAWFSIENYCKEHNIPLPHNERLLYLLRNAIKLIDEMNETIALPPNFQHHSEHQKIQQNPIEKT